MAKSKPQLKRKMWLRKGGAQVIKAESAEEAKKKWCEAFNNPADGANDEFEELTLELLDKVTDEGNFDGSEGEFTLTPGCDM